MRAVSQPDFEVAEFDLCGVEFSDSELCDALALLPEGRVALPRSHPHGQQPQYLADAVATNQVVDLGF